MEQNHGVMPIVAFTSRSSASAVAHMVSIDKSYHLLSLNLNELS